MRNLILFMCVLLLAGCPQHLKPSEPGSAAATPAGAAPAAKPGASIPPVAAGGEALEIWADPLLAPVLEALAPDFKLIYAPGYRLVLKERGELLDNLRQEGGPALPDVICADAGVITEYKTKQAVEEPTLRTFAGDRLVLAERPGFGYQSPSLYDIYQLRFTALGLGETSTLAGYYGEQALISEGAMRHVAERVKRYPATAALVDALNQDKVQAILITASAAAVGGVSAWLLIGEDLHEDIRYQAAASSRTNATPGVTELLRFLAEDAGVQATLEGYGLVRREVALEENP